MRFLRAYLFERIWDHFGEQTPYSFCRNCCAVLCPFSVGCCSLSLEEQTTAAACDHSWWRKEKPLCQEIRGIQIWGCLGMPQKKTQTVDLFLVVLEMQPRFRSIVLNLSDPTWESTERLMLMEGEETLGHTSHQRHLLLRAKNGTVNLLVSQLLTKQMVQWGQGCQRHYDSWADYDGVESRWCFLAQWRAVQAKTRRFILSAVKSLKPRPPESPRV